MRKLLDKLKEQGTQRGIIMLVPLVSTHVGLSTEDSLTLITAVLAIYGTHNTITEG
jgi:hypothetical protein